MGRYLSAVETAVNFVFRLLPIPFTAATITMEMPAAISAYSIAVVPFSALKNARNLDIIHAPFYRFVRLLWCEFEWRELTQNEPMNGCEQFQ